MLLKRDEDRGSGLNAPLYHSMRGNTAGDVESEYKIVRLAKRVRIVQRYFYWKTAQQRGSVTILLAVLSQDSNKSRAHLMLVRK